MKFYVSATALIIAMAGSSLAADLPSVQAPAYTSPSPLTWTGIYGGLNAGGAISESGSINASGPLCMERLSHQAALGPFLPRYRRSAPAARLHKARTAGSSAGASSAMVISLLRVLMNTPGSSAWRPTSRASAAAPAQAILFLPSRCRAPSTSPRSVVFLTRWRQASSPLREWITVGTVRGRLGFLVTPTLLVFGTGLAYGGANASTSILQVNNDLANFGAPPALIPAAVSRGRYADTQVGWAAGGGLEWMVLPNWSAKVEYLYADLGSAAYSLSPLVTGTIGGAFPIYAIAASQTTVSFREHSSAPV